MCSAFLPCNIAYVILGPKLQGLPNSKLPYVEIYLNFQLDLADRGFSDKLHARPPHVLTYVRCAGTMPSALWQAEARCLAVCFKHIFIERREYLSIPSKCTFKTLPGARHGVVMQRGDRSSHTQH